MNKKLCLRANVGLNTALVLFSTFLSRIPLLVATTDNVWIIKMGLTLVVLSVINIVLTYQVYY